MRIHRLLAGPLTVTATVAAGAFVAAPANAALTNPQLYAITNISHASGCSSTVTGGTSNTTFSDDGSPVTENQSSSGTVSTGSDVTQVTATGKGTVKVTHASGSLSTADFTATATGKAVPSSSSTTCAVFSEGYTYATFGFSVAHPGWVTISSSGSTSGYAFQVVQITGTNFSAFLQAAGTRMIGTNQVFLPQAGAYSTVLEYGAQGASASTFYPQQSKLAMAMHLAYTQAGGARGPASGGGTAYVKLAGARNCTGNNVSATFTSKAGKVKTATFYVNGAKKKTITSPSGGTSALLQGLSDTSAVTVKAVLALKAGGSATATRSYVPCS